MDFKFYVKHVLPNKLQPGGYSKSATRSRASAKLAFTGRGVAWVSPRSRNGGQAKVYLDGALVTTVDLVGWSTLDRSVVHARTWSCVGTHTIEVRLVGTKDRPRVDLDAIFILR